MASISGIATARAQRGFAKRMSDHIAYALVVYTLMLIFVVSPTMELRGLLFFHTSYSFSLSRWPFFLAGIWIIVGSGLTRVIPTGQG